MKTSWFLYWLAALVVFAASATTFPAGQRLRAIRAICLPGRPLPIVVAGLHGTFVKYGVEVQTEVAPNSDALRAGLASGKFDVAHAAVDNAVAMVETAGADVVIVLGGEGSTNELIAQPEIHSIRDLRGRTLIVDAPDTAYALQLKKILLAFKTLLSGPTGFSLSRARPVPARQPPSMPPSTS